MSYPTVLNSYHDGRCRALCPSAVVTNYEPMARRCGRSELVTVKYYPTKSRWPCSSSQQLISGRLDTRLLATSVLERLAPRPQSTFA
jgi:hypothetical protein